ncbi:hypothetical protein [Paractinoplanes hotanensis]|uniref:Uncharacterized protein n=1 Tax=Paractinoplanes hotanensis TaxID=2906497 RepID=A0ABT0YE35_9ACTN|nr:hypothetical protein [Actinoplanes hotanensis]MCM4084306.1 hypothetical protein [Actinoplanes hotanensis]
MKFPFRMRWSISGSASLERYVANPSELRRSFEIVTLDARYAEVVCEVDLLPLNPRPYEPVMVQFLVGHPTAARITVHGDGDTHLVRVPGFAGVEDEVRIVRGSGTAPAEPGTLMVPAGSVFELVEAICAHNEPPGPVELVEQDMD